MTRKITRAVARIKPGLQEELWLGNLDAVRDWGYAKEYVEGMWRMLQADASDDYVLATGHAMTVRDFCVAAFARVDLDWEEYVRYDARYERPSEVDALIGDASKAAAPAGLEGRRPSAPTWSTSWSTPTSGARGRARRQVRPHRPVAPHRSWPSRRRSSGRSLP